MLSGYIEIFTPKDCLGSPYWLPQIITNKSGKLLLHLIKEGRSKVCGQMGQRKTETAKRGLVRNAISQNSLKRFVHFLFSVWVFLQFSFRFGDL